MHASRSERVSRAPRVEVNFLFVVRILHTSDLHFGRPAVAAQLVSLRSCITKLAPDAVAVSGDLTQRCRNSEFARARAYLDDIRKTVPVIVIPGNHDVRWLGAVARNLGLLRKTAHEFKYSRYARHISPGLNPSLEVPGAVIAGCNTAHGISRGSLTRRLWDLGVIGHVKHRDLVKVEEAFAKADPHAARIAMIHHNPIKGELSGRHGLANTEQALKAFASLGTELVLCGHDHQEAVHAVEESSPGLVISTAGTISNRIHAGRPSSFNLVEIEDSALLITTYAWRNPEGFAPSQEHSFPRRAGASRDARSRGV
jgi:3',5'-cyclic AMP phosphodiesterase CpdA